MPSNWGCANSCAAGDAFRFPQMAWRENYSNRQMTFAREFKTARHRLGLGQGDAARKWNVPLKALQNWEQGVRTPRAQTLLRLLSVLFPERFGKAGSKHKNDRGQSQAVRARQVTGSAQNARSSRGRRTVVESRPRRTADKAKKRGAVEGGHHRSASRAPASRER